MDIRSRVVLKNRDIKDAPRHRERPDVIPSGLLPIGTVAGSSALPFTEFFEGLMYICARRRPDGNYTCVLSCRVARG
jgi:hypothetical protein